MAKIKVYVKKGEALDFMETIRRERFSSVLEFKHWTARPSEHVEIILSQDEYEHAITHLKQGSDKKDAEEFFETDRFFPPEEDN